MKVSTVRIKTRGSDLGPIWVQAVGKSYKQTTSFKGQSTRSYDSFYFHNSLAVIFSTELWAFLIIGKNENHFSPVYQ